MIPSIFISSSSSTNPNTAMITPVQKHRSVRFSEYSEVFVVEPQGIWHTTAERLSFRSQVIRDAIHIRRMMAANPEQENVFTEDDKYICIGIEMFLSRSFAREIMERRHQHVQSILREQSVHRIRDTVNDDELRRVSEVTSLWGREIARSRAIAYMDI
ncbi:hypothetical protein ACHAXS_005518 [Conticribra weissflogii]